MLLPFEAEVVVLAVADGVNGSTRQLDVFMMTELTTMLILLVWFVVEL